jgi:branched-chain amino acid transport system ATP-binding protein
MFAVGHTRCLGNPGAALIMLRAEGIKVRYGEIEAIHGVELTVGEREVVALIGANGAGKSTTLNALSGLLPTTGGKIIFQGTDITGWPADKISRQGMSLTPEGRRVFAQLTVAENLMLGGAAHAGRVERVQRQEELLELFPVLRSRLTQKAGNMSGGEQQMLAIARSLMSKPKLLLLDEPSLGLAPQMVDKVFDLIVALRKAGLSILLVEQNVGLALEIADRASVLRGGSIALSGSAEELASSDLVRQAYLGVH